MVLEHIYTEEEAGEIMLTMACQKGPFQAADL